MLENQKALEALEYAIRDEIRAYTFYDTLGKKVEDKKVRYLLKNLCQDEVIHKKMLDERYVHLSEGKEYKYDEKTEFDFNSDVSLKNRKEILEMAVELEIKAKEFYLSQAKLVPDNKCQEIFRDLAIFEEEHRIRLMELIESLD